MVRITTWNVNGIRNPFGYEPWRKNRSFSAMFDILETDIVIMQELKIQRKDLTDDMVLVPAGTATSACRSTRKDTLVLEYTLDSLYVHLFAPKRVFLGSSVRLVHQHRIVNDPNQTA